MSTKTLALWEKQDRHKGDRWRLFQAVSTAVSAQKVLYPGCYVDIAPSFVFADVTYADMDRRAAQFFGDEPEMRQIIADHGGAPHAKVQFIHGDYHALPLKERSFDLLISLYAGFISDACGHLLGIGGLLLVNSSHGDVALAALDPRFELSAVVVSASGQYKIDDHALERFLIPKKSQIITRERVRQGGIGIAYTRTPYAYLFKRVS